MAERYNFKYLPLVGKLPGKSMVEQTETAINELASVVYDNVGHVGNLAEEVQTANTNASNALGKATEALETSGRVYIKLIAAVDVNDYYDSELYYINNDGSTNIPVRDRGFLEVKTNDDKTACEQVFIADSTGTPYYRHGRITEQTLGEETTYVVTWGSWYQGATTEFVNAKAKNYLPLSGGTLTGAINTANNTWNKLGDDASFGDHNVAGKMCIKSQNYFNTGIAFFNQSDTNVGIVDVNNAFNFNKPVKENGGFLVPIGVVQAFAGSTTPQGWLLCDGSAVSRTDYAALFAVIGDTYGAGDGSTTFNLPNLVDKFVEGSATAGAVKSAGLPNITGTFGFRPVDGGMNVTWETDNGAVKATTNTDDSSICVAKSSSSGPLIDVTIDASRSSSVYGNSTTVQPPALTMRYIIKY